MPVIDDFQYMSSICVKLSERLHQILDFLDPIESVSETFQRRGSQDREPHHVGAKVQVACHFTWY
jgi:hypothetical protein